MENSRVLHKIEVPEEWESRNDYDSHRPLLYLIINKVPHDTLFEFGVGYGSTPPLAKWYNEINTFCKEYYSLETNKEWFDKFHDGYGISFRSDTFVDRNHCIILSKSPYTFWEIFDNSIVFIDAAPGEIRKELIEKYKDKAKAIVVHDTEEGANYVYGMKDILSTFKYRIDYRPEKAPHTTAVSNFVDITQLI